MKKVVLAGIALLMLSCNQAFQEDYTSHLEEEFIENGTIPVADALQVLESFLQDEKTKSSGESNRRIQSVETHYKTVDTQKGTYRIPQAYIVQYEDGQGFAVLGANRNVDNIIAVIDKGTIDAQTLKVSSREGESELTRFVEDLIKVGLSDKSGGDRGEGGDGGEGGEGGEGGGIDWEEEDEFDELGDENGGPVSYYTTRLPMLNFSWAQGDLYNMYCYNPMGTGHRIPTGCSTTALAMIMAAIEFPQTMIINSTLMDWQAMKWWPNISYYYNLPTIQDQFSHLMGAIFNLVEPAPLYIHIGDYSGTLVFPEAIKDLMTDFGFENVTKLSGGSLNNNMVAAISNMLRDDKPVFISAAHNLSGAHSWVIDGAKYSYSTYLLHFNFGWHGDCNGYFSRDCLNPTQGYQYDNGSSVSQYYNHTYNWNFRVITYDIPSYPYTLEVAYYRY